VAVVDFGGSPEQRIAIGCGIAVVAVAVLLVVRRVRANLAATVATSGNA
jgi:hypothetical protein